MIFLILILCCEFFWFGSGSSIFGFKTKNSVLITSSNSVEINGITMHQDFEWLRNIGTEKKCCLALNGDVSDCEFLWNQIIEENNIHELSFGRPYTVHAMANICRNLIGKFIRSKQGPLKVNAMLAGWDYVEDRPVLYWLDNLGGIQEVSSGAHGPEFVLILSFLDRALLSNNKSENLDVESAITTISSCWTSLKKRTTKHLKKISVKAITANSITYKLISLD